MSKISGENTYATDDREVRGCADRAGLLDDAPDREPPVGFRATGSTQPYDEISSGATSATAMTE